jgi:hypothetical protein
MRVLAFLVGIILLLPGACSLGFMALFIGSGGGGDVAPYTLLWLVCFAISFGGVMLIRSALRRREPGPGDPPT